MSILHLNDWGLYPNAIIHTTTTNTTFLRMADLYSSMGIKNHFFHLALLNPNLRYLDPFNPNLTKDEMVAIGIECRLNPWYYFREVARVPPRAGSTPVSLKANRGNLVLYWLFFNHIDTFLVQPRQTGKSLSVDELMIYLLDIATQNTLINLLTKDSTLRQENVERLKAIRALIPKYISMFDSKKDSDNKEGLTCKNLENRYRIGIGQQNELSAYNLGRGITSAIIHNDEGPFIKYMDVVVPALLKAGNAVRDEAKKMNAHYGNIFTTTAGKKDSRSGKYMYDLMVGGMVCDERVLFDLGNAINLENIVRVSSHGIKPLISITFSHKQLGYTDEWLALKMRESASTADDADRDYFNRWTSGGLTSPLSTVTNEEIKNSMIDAIYPQIVKTGYVLRWYIDKNLLNEILNNDSFIMGIDTSDAIGRDSITMVVISASTLETVCAASVSETSVLRFANFIADILIMYPNITCIPERKSSWVALVETLILRLTQAKIDPFKRIYNVIVDRHETMAEEYKQITKPLNAKNNHFYETMKKHFGFNTAGSGEHSREVLYTNVFERASQIASTKIRDRQLCNELLGLETKNGRIDHGSDSHDDMVIAWLLCNWMLMFSKNLQFYGIRTPMRKAHVRADIQYDPYKEYLEEEQDNILAEVNRLLLKMKEEKNEIIFLQIESKLKNLEKRMDSKHLENLSINNLIKDIKEQKRKNSRRSFNTNDENPFNTFRRYKSNVPDSWA